jgi:molybdopterin molybdotransferase
MTDVVDAERMISERMAAFGSQQLPLSAAVDAILHERIDAERDQPPFDRVTMDGIAIAFRDWQTGTRSFQVIGTQRAGVPPLSLTERGQCAEVMTGAVLPRNADCVIPVERLLRVGERAELLETAQASVGQFIHPRGSDRKKASPLLRPGTRLTPPEIAIVASAGLASIKTAKLPHVAIVSTGDELVGVDDAIEDFQIRSSNDRAIEACLVRHHAAEVSRSQLNDEHGKMLDAIRDLHAKHDVLILSGGVSMGQFDFVPSVLEELGVELVFHKIEQRPGRPMLFGVSRDKKPVFALPGNPVSTMVCLRRYVVPALLQALGLKTERPELVFLADNVEFSADLTYFCPVVVNWANDGRAIAEPRPTNTSGDFVSLAGTDGFVELPRGQDQFERGRVVRLFRW